MVKNGTVQTLRRLAMNDRMEESMIMLTPFKELRLGEESIHDWVDTGYNVPEKVISYLRTTEPYVMSPGIYEHPFVPGKQLLGPYVYTDDRFCWDRDAWKYVVKYHVRLPQEFIDYVMSGEGDEFLKKHQHCPDSWQTSIEEQYEGESYLNLLPKDAGDIGLEDF